LIGEPVPVRGATAFWIGSPPDSWAAVVLDELALLLAPAPPLVLLLLLLLDEPHPAMAKPATVSPARARPRIGRPLNCLHICM
jgi:hypothetical protein